MRLSTHRIIQLSDLADTLSAKARSATRGAANLARIGNARGSRYMAVRAARYAVLADACAQRLACASPQGGEASR